MSQGSSRLDVPVTTEAEQRIRQLDAFIARLEQEVKETLGQIMGC